MGQWIMTADDIRTMKAVLLYIISHIDSGRRDVYSIVKAAYYAQQLHFAKWATPIFRDRISALPFGPVPSTIYNILKIARGDVRELSFYRNVNISEASDAIGFENESFFPKETPDMEYLSESAVECMDAAIAKVSSMGFGAIMNDTHSAEWRRAFESPGSKVMDNLKIAEEAGADEGVLQYLRESLEWDKSFCQ